MVQWTPFIQTYKHRKYQWVQLAGHSGNFKAGQRQGTVMKKLCASTLSEILPQEVAERINKKVEEDPSVSSHDFLTLVGMLSYF